MNILVVSCSLHRQSRSARLAQAAIRSLVRRGIAADHIDLRDWDLPLCDGLHAPIDRAALALAERIERAHAALLAVPIYNYDANAAAKNLIELTGKAWQDKIVGFLCAAGGHGSYMSVISLANSLMLDFRCLIVPRFVYATRHAFDDQSNPSEKIGQRIEELCDQLCQLTRAINREDDMLSDCASG